MAVGDAVPDAIKPEIAPPSYQRAAAACRHKSASAAITLQTAHVSSAPTRQRRLALRRQARKTGSLVAPSGDVSPVSDLAVTPPIGYFAAPRLAPVFGTSKFSTSNRSTVPSARSESIAWPRVTERKESFDRSPMPSSVGDSSNGAGMT